MVNLLVGYSKKTLVLDLDETLIHSTPIKPRGHIVPKNFRINWRSSTGEVCSVYTCLRPGVSQFLNWAAERFEIVIFTASMPAYAKQVVRFLENGRHKFYLFTRSDCVFEHGMFVKDLSIINRDIKDIIIIDNFPESYSRNPENGLPIESWYSNMRDTELENMKTVLERLNTVHDVRQYIRKFVIKDKI